MNKILKLGILYGSIIYLGLCFALAQNIRGLYDINVDIKNAYDPSAFSVYTTLNFDREVVIHSKTNFVFSELPEFFAEYSDDGSGGVHTTSHQIRVFARFYENPLDTTWREIFPNSQVLIDYGSRVTNGNNTITISIAAATDAQISAIAPDRYDLLMEKRWEKGVSYTIKEESSRPYISPNRVIDIETDAVYATTASTYAPSTLQKSTFFQPYVQATKGKGNAYVLYANPANPNITKPIIFVDGIDFSRTSYIDPALNKIVRNGVTGWDIFIRGLEEDFLPPGEKEPYRLYRSTFDMLREQNFDIIFLDFTEGATYMEKNAQVLRKFIQMLNGVNGQAGLKIADSNGQMHENIIVGCSMGGQVTRLCLSEMEENGEETCTSTYVSFDSPHLGANIPLSLQALAWYASETLDEDDNNSLWNKLNTPAARQLLTNTLGNSVKKGDLTIGIPSWSDPMNTSFPDNYDLFTPFQTKIHQLGLPKSTRNIAISCGSNEGVAKSVSAPATTLLRGSVDVSQGRVIALHLNSLNGIPSNDGVIKFCTVGQAVGGNTVGLATGNKGIFLAAAPDRFKSYNFIPLPPTPCGYKAAAVSINNNLTFPNLDGAPGCYRNDIFTVTKLFEKSAEQAGLNFSIAQTFAKTTFMPTVSLLDLKWQGGLNQTNMDRVIETEFQDFNNIIRKKETLFDNVFASDKNLQHVEIDEALQAWAVQEVTDSEGVNFASPMQSTFNYGRKKNSIPSVVIESTGHVQINECGATGFTNNPSAPDLNL